MKVAIRLLMFKPDIDIDDFNKIVWIHEDSGKYHFFLKTLKEEKRITLDEDTIQMAIPLLKEGKLAGGERSRQEAFETLSIKLHIEPNITPFDLRKFSYGLHPEDIRKYVLA